MQKRIVKEYTTTVCDICGVSIEELGICINACLAEGIAAVRTHLKLYQQVHIRQIITKLFVLSVINHYSPKKN